MQSYVIARQMYFENNISSGFEVPVIKTGCQALLIRS
jgi:hypothetical protein